MLYGAFDIRIFLALLTMTATAESMFQCSMLSHTQHDSAPAKIQSSNCLSSIRLHINYNVFAATSCFPVESKHIKMDFSCWQNKAPTCKKTLYLLPFSINLNWNCFYIQYEHKCHLYVFRYAFSSWKRSKFEENVKEKFGRKEN